MISILMYKATILPFVTYKKYKYRTNGSILDSFTKYSIYINSYYRMLLQYYLVIVIFQSYQYSYAFILIYNFSQSYLFKYKYQI